MVEVLNHQSSAASLGFAAGSPVTWIVGMGCEQSTMQSCSCCSVSCWTFRFPKEIEEEGLGVCCPEGSGRKKRRLETKPLYPLVSPRCYHKRQSQANKELQRYRRSNRIGSSGTKPEREEKEKRKNKKKSPSPNRRLLSGLTKPTKPQASVTKRTSWRGKKGGFVETRLGGCYCVSRLRCVCSRAR